MEYLIKESRNRISFFKAWSPHSCPPAPKREGWVGEDISEQVERI